MTKEQAWLTGLTALLMLGLVGTVVAIASVRADLVRLDQHLAHLASGNPAGAGERPRTPRDAGGWDTQPTAQPGGPSGHIQGISALSDTLQITVTVRFSGPANLLYEPPVLKGAQATYRPTPGSLEKARLDFLNLVTRGEATTTFSFQPVPSQDESLALIFNPNHPRGDRVAPRWEMIIRAEGAGN
jgi:hypothetical protein